MESEDLKLGRCPSCGAVKMADRPCRFCEEGLQQLAEEGSRAASTGWDDLVLQPLAVDGGSAGPRQNRRLLWIALGIMIVLAAVVLAVVIGSSRGDEYAARMRAVSADLAETSGELATLLGRGSELDQAELTRVRALCDELSASTREGWKLHPTEEVVGAHSLFTGALTNLDLACGTARGFVDQAIATMAPDERVSRDALASLSAAGMQLLEAGAALEGLPAEAT